MADKTNASERIKKYIKDGRYLRLNHDNIEKFFTKEGTKLEEIEPYQFTERLEPKTRYDDLSEALRFSIHDPLWLLARQWQMGEFRANDAGTALSVKCTISQEECKVQMSDKSSVYSEPIEPNIEQINPKIDWQVRVESAMHYVELISSKKTFSKSLLDEYCTKYSLWDEAKEESMIGYNYDDNNNGKGKTSFHDYEEIPEKEQELNSRRIMFQNSFKHAFDGYKLYLDLKKGKSHASYYDDEYVKWFEKNYLPCQDINSNWNKRELNYSVKVNTESFAFSGDRYQGGRVSWHTVDFDADRSRRASPEKTMVISSLPTLATYQGAPNKRLWQFEDHKVYMGNSMQQQSQANELFLKFATMYANDWMIIPFDTKIGSFINVEQIEIKDSFGIEKVIKKANNSVKDHFFTNNFYRDPSKTMDGLFFAPQLVTTLEGKPIEEVDLLRDEMANMIWGVEMIASDECGTTIDQKRRAEQLKQIIDDHNDQKNEVAPSVVELGNETHPETDSKIKPSVYKYSLQTNVPFNWIPFVPQQLNERSIILRRGKMPCFIMDKEMNSVTLPVYPVTSILREGCEADDKYEPMYINEEEVQQTGIKLVKNYQRTRWINGKSYNWLGLYKKLAKFSENSGLEFDTIQKK